jgi:hypothetical protein
MINDLGSFSIAKADSRLLFISEQNKTGVPHRNILAPKSNARVRSIDLLDIRLKISLSEGTSVRNTIVHTMPYSHQSIVPPRNQKEVAMPPAQNRISILGIALQSEGVFIIETAANQKESVPREGRLRV